MIRLGITRPVYVRNKGFVLVINFCRGMRLYAKSG